MSNQAGTRESDEIVNVFALESALVIERLGNELPEGFIAALEGREIHEALIRQEACVTSCQQTNALRRQLIVWRTLVESFQAMPTMSPDFRTSLWSSFLEEIMKIVEIPVNERHERMKEFPIPM